MSTEVEEKTNTEAEKKLNKKTLFIIGGVVLGIAIVVLAVFLVISFNKQDKYKKAIEMYNEKQYEQAVTAFSELGNYKNSAQYLDQCNLDKAIELFEQGNYSDAVILLEALGGYGDAVSYLDKCYTAIGDSLIESGSYDDALTEYSKINDSEQKAEMLKKCDYSKAMQLFYDKNYQEAMAAFEALGTYSDSSSYIDKCKIEMKYTNFDFTGNSEYESFYMYYGEGERLADSAAAEKKLSFIYGTWYDDSDNKAEITPTLFNGEEYKVCALSDNTALVSMYFPKDGLDSLYVVFVSDDSILGKKLYIIQNSSVHISAAYSSVTTAEYNKAYAQWQEEQQAQTPNYSNDEIVNLAAQKSQDKLRSAYRAAGYTPTEMIYHTCTVQSSSVNYDWTTRTYTCYLTVAYSTNIFDVFGTSTSYFDVVATYEDTGNGLASTGFSIS